MIRMFDQVIRGHLMELLADLSFFYSGTYRDYLLPVQRKVHVTHVCPDVVVLFQCVTKT